MMPLFFPPNSGEFVDGQTIGQLTGEFVDGLTIGQLTGEFVDGQTIILLTSLLASVADAMLDHGHGCRRRPPPPNI
jgi:hypothetical protein